MNTPLAGSLVQKIHLSRFSLCMYLLLQSRTPLVEAIELVKKIFKSLKDQYNAEVEQRTTILANLIEPVLIIFIGLFVGIILVSMYLPMFKLSTSLEF